MSLTFDFRRSDYDVEFKIRNNNSYKIALINALRRIILANIETVCIERDSVKFYENFTIFNDDFLSQRLSLIPLYCDFFDNKDIDDFRLECSYKNEDLNIYNLTTKDIKVFYKEEEIDNSKIFVHEDTLICRLKQNNNISFSCKIKKGSLKNNGAGYSPVSQASYCFEKDETEIKKIISEKEKLNEIKSDLEKENFILKKGDRFYKKTSSSEPSTYIFTIESTGVIKLKNIFSLACDYLINKCEFNINREFIIDESPTNMKGYDFIFEDEDDTLGNLLQKYLFDEKNVSYVGYIIPHPLEKKMKLRLSLNKENHTEKEYKETIVTMLKKIIKLTKELKQSYLGTFK